MLVMSDRTRQRVEDIVNDAKALAAEVQVRSAYAGRGQDGHDKRSFQEHEARQLVKVSRRLAADAICFARLLEGTLAKTEEDARVKEEEAAAPE